MEFNESMNRLSPQELAWIKGFRLSYNIPTTASIFDTLDLIIIQVQKPEYPTIRYPERKAYYVFAMSFENTWINNPPLEKNPWDLIYAIKYWRRAGEPERAIAISSNIPEEKDWPEEIRSAFHNTRGASFRELKDYRSAHVEVDESIRLNDKSHHPYNLKGKILIEQWKLEEGIYNFELARQLARPGKKQDVIAEQNRIIKEVLKTLSLGTVLNMTSRLIKKDPVLYSWLIKYRDDAIERLENESPNQFEFNAEPHGEGVKPFFSEEDIDLVQLYSDEREKYFISNNYSDISMNNYDYSNDDYDDWDMEED